MITIINAGRNIRTSADMVPVTKWINNNATGVKWKWKISEEWIKGWGHPLIIEFENPISPEFVTLFKLMFG